MVDCGLPCERPAALTVAGSDPSGGAGLQADLKTFHQFGVYGMAVPAVLTSQNTLGVEAVFPVEPAFVRSQLDCIQRDIPPRAAKTGALGSAETVCEVASWARNASVPLVVDPVISSTSGQPLSSEDGLEALVRSLLPQCLMVTPNLYEAGEIAGMTVQSLEDMRRAAGRIADLGPKWVLVTGGHLRGDAVDVLWSGGQVRLFRATRIAGPGHHGTGCAYSAAIAALLSLGRTPPEAVRVAKKYVTEAIRRAPELGRGNHPVDHHASAKWSGMLRSGRPDF